MGEYLQVIFRGKLEKCEPIRRVVKIPIRFIEYLLKLIITIKTEIPFN